MFEILQFGFMQRAFLAGMIIACIAPLVGTFLVVKRYSLIADTLSHVALSGVAIGMVLNFSPIISSIFLCVFTSVLIEELRFSKKFSGESILAVFLSGSLALTTILISIKRGFNVILLNYLFGSITTVTEVDTILIFLVGIIILGTFFVFYQRFFLISLDEETSLASGINVKRYNRLIIILTGLLVAVSIRIIGSLLIGALMVIPVLTAQQWGKSFKQTITFSILIAFFCVFSGLFLSYQLNLASGGTIVFLAFSLFSLSPLIKNGVNK